jgi:hypothetical protein
MITGLWVVITKSSNKVRINKSVERITKALLLSSISNEGDVSQGTKLEFLPYEHHLAYQSY